MNTPQGEIVPFVTTSQANEATQKIIRQFHQSLKTILILSYNDLTDDKNEICAKHIRHDMNWIMKALYSQSTMQRTPQSNNQCSYYFSESRILLQSERARKEGKKIHESA